MKKAAVIFAVCSLFQTSFVVADDLKDSYDRLQEARGAYQKIVSDGGADASVQREAYTTYVKALKEYEALKADEGATAAPEETANELSVSNSPAIVVENQQAPALTKAEAILKVSNETYRILQELRQAGAPIPEAIFIAAKTGYQEAKEAFETLSGKTQPEPVVTKPPAPVQTKPSADVAATKPAATTPAQAKPAAASTEKNGLKVGENATVNVNSALNFRKSPWGTIIGTFKPGDQVKVAGFDGEWVKITANGKTGYVHGNYLKPAAKVTPPANNGGIPVFSGKPPAAKPPLGSDSTREQRLNYYAEDIIYGGCSVGVPPSIVAAQLIIESNVARAMPAGSNNPFGVKCGGSSNCVTARTAEYNSRGEKYYIDASFRAFDSVGQAIQEHASRLRGLKPGLSGIITKPFNEALAKRDYDGMIDRGLLKYATSPDYRSDLKDLIRTNKLKERFDSKCPAVRDML